MREGKPIYVVPLKIRCEDGEYSDGVDITAEGVYERLHRGELPRTSLPEGGVVSDTLDQIRADGYERVIASCSPPACPHLQHGAPPGRTAGRSGDRRL